MLLTARIIHIQKKCHFLLKEKSGQASIKYLAHRGASNLAPENTIKII